MVPTTAYIAKLFTTLHTYAKASICTAINSIITLIADTFYITEPVYAISEKIYLLNVPIEDNNLLLLQSNLTHLPRHEYVPGIGMGVAKCPYDPADNSTALWVEKGNPGSLPALYSGTNAEFTKADTVIFRTDLHNLTTGRREFAFKRTLKYDSKWLDSEY